MNDTTTTTQDSKPAAAAEQPKTNVPDSLSITRNGITLTYDKIPSKRKGKGGKVLPPVFAPQIASVDSELAKYRQFIGDDLFFSDLNAICYQRSQRQQKELWSANGLMFDSETASKSAQLATIKSETTDDLKAEMDAIAIEFTEANKAGNQVRAAELMVLMADNLSKQAAKRHNK